MEIRDAIEADAERLASLTGAPTDVMRNLVHDRTVRVAEENDTVTGFVSFDARRETVHVTQLEGDADLCTRLLKEPIRFASTENMTVELLIAVDDTPSRKAAETAGFTEHGPGPRFDGTQTLRYRWEMSTVAEN